MQDMNIELEFRRVRQAMKSSTVNILSLRTALVAKSVCTKEELDEYDKAAEAAVDQLLTQERDNFVEATRQANGDEAAEAVSRVLELEKV